MIKQKTRQHRSRLDKTDHHQDKTRQDKKIDKTNKDKTRHDKTKDKTKKIKIRQVKKNKDKIRPQRNTTQDKTARL